MTRPQEIRKEILLQLYSTRPLALSPATMARQANKADLDYTVREVAAECHFLLGQEMVDRQTDPVSGGSKFSISSRGVIHYENGEGR